jgi:two-component system OmpR family response regulator
VRVLVAEDDDRAADYMVRGLTESGHVVDRVADGETALAMALEGIYEAVILDRKLPGMDGIAVIRRLRDHDRRIPVLMLSAIASARDRVDGIQAGCDDYLAKPYAFAELLARLEALTRRADATRQGGLMVQVGDLMLDVESRTATRAGKMIRLQRREFLLLEHLVRHAGQVVTRAMLLEAAWDYDFDPRSNIVDMHIHRLRQKLNEGFAEPLIETVRDAGYRIGAAIGSVPNNCDRS